MTTIESHPDAKDGLVLRPMSYEARLFTPGSIILCRNTAPLVAFAYALLHRDVPCKILGRDIGAQLTAVVKKLRPVTLSDFLDKLKTWETRESERAVADDRSPDRIYDQATCLRFFCDSLDEESRSVASLLAKIDLMFTDDTNGGSANRVTLSTIHKAKGLEFPTVFILDFHLMPSRYAKQSWQLRQENNLIYVAITRSMDTLVYISSDCWKE